MNEEREVKVITNALLKAVVIVSACVMGAVTLHSCRLDSDTIADCNDACMGSSGQMESVTSYTCKCTNKTEVSSPWVLN